MIDVFVIVLIGGFAALGWRRGFVVTSLATLAFLLAGLFAGALAAAIGAPPPVLVFALVGLLAMVPVALRAEAIRDSIESRLEPGGVIVERVGGAVVGGSLAVVLAWFLAAVASIAPSNEPILDNLRSSSVLTTFIDSVPPSGNLGSLVLRSGAVPSLSGPLVLASEPDDASARTPQVVAAQQSVLQVSGVACKQQVTGTGWVAGPGLIITNAHVVAGQTETTLSGGPAYEGFRATVTAYDVAHDVAVLTADGQVLPPPIPLRLDVQHDQRAAVIGFPRGGERRIIPARIDRVATWPTEPVGGGPDVEVPILAFRAEVQTGNSGGPVLAEDGSALGLVVAKGLGQRVEAAYGIASADLQELLVQGARRVPVSTGPCLRADEHITGD